MTLETQHDEQTLLVLFYLAYESLYIFSHMQAFTQYKMQNSERFGFKISSQIFILLLKYLIS